MNHQITASNEFRRHFELPPDLSQASTVGEIIRRRAEVQGDHAAITSSDCTPLSYRELQNLIDEVRARLRSAGFDRNARIAIAMPSGPQAALAIVAVACSAVSIPLNPRQTLREIEVCLTALRPDAVLLMKTNGSVAQQAAERQGLAVIEAIPTKEGILGFSIIQPKSSPAATHGEPDEPDPTAPAFILQTSGTAAEPKLIPFSHRNMLAAAARLQAWFNLTPQDRCLSVSPPFYSHGLKVTVFAPLLTGGTVLFPKDPSKFDYTEWFSLLKPTWYSAGPTLHRLIFDQIQFRADAKTGHSLRFILSGGAPLPRNVLIGLHDMLGVPVVEHYGSSEAAQIAANRPVPGLSKLGTCGIPWPDTVQIMGEDGQRAPQGEQGEILVGGPTLISGYLNAPELNRASFVDGWFKTGDIGSLDEDGFLTLHGRKDDVINRGAEKISPLEIDEALMRHPAIAEAAAFSVPHARLGEDVAAAVVLRSGMTATPVELRRYLQDQLASFKVPRRIVVRDQLPKGKTGKVLRRQLSGSFEEKIATETQIAAPRLSDDTAADSTLIIQLTDLWERLLQIKPLLPDDDFSEKGGDSLLAMEMLSEVERLTGQTIPSSILFEASTIRQLAQKLYELENLRSKSLIQINPNGGRLPLFFFHGDYAGGFYAARLANLLGSDQPLFVIGPHGLGEESIPRSIEAMAADRLPLIRDAQAKGPYRLCGYCNGGIVAFEVARMLVAAGEEVQTVGMIDPPIVNSRRALPIFATAMRYARPILGSVGDRAVSWTWHRCLELQSFLNLPSTQRWARIRYNIRKRSPGGGNHVPAATGSLSGSPAAPRGMYRALSMYSPTPLAARIIYFSAEYGSGACRRLSSDIEIVKIGGDHRELVSDPAKLARIAHHLTEQLQACE
jgi:acyl-CoA synthetase (AMP-forming)/AMP-acid ligase II/thioesterase domain-containing protein/acyl carrier protein